MIPDAKTGHGLYIALYAFLAAGIIVQLWLLQGAVYDGDLAVMTSFAGRMMTGLPMAENYFDPNPPYNFILAIPPVFIAKMTGWPIYDAHLLYSILLGAISCMFSIGLIAHLGITKGVRHLLGGAVLLCAFILPQLQFGDRDHLALLGLMPICFAQISLMKKDRGASRFLLYGSVIFGAALILLKPHYGMIPLSLWAYRAAKIPAGAKWYACDFIILASACFLYGLLHLLLFPDYIFKILPDAAAIYSAQRNPAIWPESLVFGLLTLIIGFSALTIPSRRDETHISKTAIKILMTVTLMALGVYVLQGKGLDYHRIPFLAGFFMLIVISAYSALQTRLNAQFSCLVAIMIMAAGIISLRPMPPHPLSHDEFTSLPFSKILDRDCPAPCTFLMMADHSDIIYRLAVYHNARHASRFTTFWFLPGIMSTAESEKAAYYRAMVSEDLQKILPQLIIVQHSLPTYPGFDFMNFFETSPDFKAIIEKDYIRGDRLEIDQRQYHPNHNTSFEKTGPQQFDIYVRKKSGP